VIRNPDSNHLKVAIERGGEHTFEECEGMGGTDEQLAEHLLITMGCARNVQGVSSPHSVRALGRCETGSYRHALEVSFNLTHD
jgi:hypothetical protein